MLCKGCAMQQGDAFVCRLWKHLFLGLLMLLIRCSVDYITCYMLMGLHMYHGPLLFLQELQLNPDLQIALPLWFMVCRAFNGLSLSVLDLSAASLTISYRSQMPLQFLLAPCPLHHQSIASCCISDSMYCHKLHLQMFNLGLMNLSVSDVFAQLPSAVVKKQFIAGFARHHESPGHIISDVMWDQVFWGIVTSDICTWVTKLEFNRLQFVLKWYFVFPHGFAQSLFVLSHFNLCSAFSPCPHSYSCFGHFSHLNPSTASRHFTKSSQIPLKETYWAASCLIQCLH